MPGRRPLHFDRLDEVPAEVDRLLAGHRTVGEWSLAQICSHLAAALLLSMDAGPGGSEVAPSAAVERAWNIARRRFFRSGSFPEGVELPTPALDPGPAGADLRASADVLCEAVGRFLAAPGPFSVHPMLGAMGRDEWLHFHRMHCAHHLGFALPPAVDARGGGASHSG